MELMSSLLLCVLVTLVPQILGFASNIKDSENFELKFNNTILIHQKPTLRKQLLLNINGQPLVNNISEIQSVFTDIVCKKCHICMERAIKAHDIELDNYNKRPHAKELRESILSNEIGYRYKRDTNETGSEKKKIKSKRNRMHKSVTVTKLNLDDEVYALKVKETHTNPGNVNDSTICTVYSVKKNYPCDSVEGGTLLTNSKRKATLRKQRKMEEKTKSSSTPSNTNILASIYKKREIDSSQVMESFMPSIELYN